MGGLPIFREEKGLNMAKAGKFLFSPDLDRIIDTGEARETSTAVSSNLLFRQEGELFGSLRKS